MTIADPIAFMVVIGASMFILSFVSYGLGRQEGRREVMAAIKVINELDCELDDFDDEPQVKRDDRPS